MDSTAAGSGLGRLVMAISDKEHRMDSYRPEVVVMMAC